MENKSPDDRSTLEVPSAITRRTFIKRSAGTMLVFGLAGSAFHTASAVVMNQTSTCKNDATLQCTPIPCPDGGAVCAEVPQDKRGSCFTVAGDYEGTDPVSDCGFSSNDGAKKKGYYW